MSKEQTWLENARPGGKRIARARIRNDEDRAEIERHAPADLLPADTIHACIEAAATDSPDKAAILQLTSPEPDADPVIISYGSLLAQIEQAAVLFCEIAGDQIPVVSVICPLVPEGLIAMWAAETVGISNPINPFLDVAGAAAIMNKVGTQVLVVGSTKHGAGVWDRLDALTALVPTLKRVLQVDGDEDFKTAVAHASRERFKSLPRRPGDVDASYMPTGGTTAAPKLVRHTQAKQLLNAWLMGALNGAAESEVVGHAMPNFHVGGSVCTALRAIIFGQTLLTLTPDGFRHPGVVRQFWSIARRFGMTNVIAAPATAAAILTQGDSPTSEHSIHTFSCGGSTIPLELLEAFHKRFGVYLRELWGMTEVHGVMTGHPNDGQRPALGSVGRRFAFHQIKAVILEDGRFVREAAPRERGILVGKGPCVSEGYLDAAATRQLFSVAMPDGEIWANFGDVGSIDEAGHVWVHGREKDLIIRGGHKLDPMVIEQALQAHPDVVMSAAVGKPDAARGELPMAYVQLKPGASASPEELIAFCKSTIDERAAVPVQIVVLEALPMTAVAKIAKPILRQDALRRAALEVAHAQVGADAVLSLEVDHSGTRPVANFVLGLPLAEHDAAVARLQSAFLGFEFGTRFTRSA